ncbi:MAG: hypothetical protein OFPII_39550 [Osedax symbiont Rs1]|nr:MAG: hypothetical protein OFPII_39550 [Osedax symbiont Rs1]
MVLKLKPESVISMHHIAQALYSTAVRKILAEAAGAAKIFQFHCRTNILHSVFTLKSRIQVKHIIVLVMVASLFGCTTGYAPVSDLNYPSSKSYSHRAASGKVKRSSTRGISTYRVKAGDTLYSIAWKYGLDFKQLAKNNGIGVNYLIRNDQLLIVSSTTGKRQASSYRDSKINSANKLLENRDKNKKIIRHNVKNKTEKLLKLPRKSPRKIKKSTSYKQGQQRLSKVRWQWPTKGLLIDKFSRENKGLNLAGKTGDSVFAAASGKVVYAGNGIIGYGNLIIIKHSQQYLSAYAHNSVILIKEQATVKAGVKIAEIGSSGTIKTILHFEIREDGKPVNPLKYLPKK